MGITHIIPVLEDLHWLPASQRVGLQGGLDGLEMCSWCRSIQLTSATYAFPLLPSQVVSFCDLQLLVLYGFHAPGLQLDNEVSQSTDQPRGTVCHQHYGHRTCRRTPSSGHWRRICSRPPGAIGTFSWFWRRISRLTLLFRQVRGEHNHSQTRNCFLNRCAKN